tara:strand:- start:4115 stop:4318 length:204 start_codon:yes stop_codon:yes gene_type:complete
MTNYEYLISYLKAGDSHKIIAAKFDVPVSHIVKLVSMLRWAGFDLPDAVAARAQRRTAEFVERRDVK